MFRRLSITIAVTGAVVAASSGLVAATNGGTHRAVYIGGGSGGLFNALCAHVLGDPAPPSGDTVTKAAQRHDRSDGGTDLSVTLSAAASSRRLSATVFDCVWIDTDGDGHLTPGTEQARAYVAPLTAGSKHGSTRSLAFTVDVPGAAGVSVCDRAYGVSLVGLGLHAGSRSSGWTTFTSNTVCGAPAPPTSVPEVPLVPLLGISAAIVGGGAVLATRRHRAPA